VSNGFDSTGLSSIDSSVTLCKALESFDVPAMRLAYGVSRQQAESGVPKPLELEYLLRYKPSAAIS
jgi:hypothetical protein